MTDPVWRKTAELTEGYQADFNAMSVYNLVRDAWRMGFNVVRDPAAPALYLDFIRAQNEALRNCPAAGIAGLRNAHQPGDD